MSRIILLSIFFSITISINAEDYKRSALDEFKKEHYKTAIDLLQNALKENSKDPEIYYYLGVFIHYQQYDSAPFVSSSIQSTSDTVLKYFKKAVELRPDYGDAYYFIGAEYGARAIKYMRERDVKRIKNEYYLSRQLPFLGSLTNYYGKDRFLRTEL